MAYTIAPSDFFLMQNTELQYKNESLEVENAKLREFASQLIRFIDPTEHQDSCNRECPAYHMCDGNPRCAFVEWLMGRARELEIEVGE